MRNLLKITLATMLTIASIHASSLIVAADEWCPINCKPNAQNPGFAIELLQKTLSKKDYKVEYVLDNWVRALRGVDTGVFDAVVGTDGDECEHCVYPQEPILEVSVGFFVKNESEWRYKDINSLREKKVCAITGYTYTDDIDAYILENSKNRKKIVQTFGTSALLECFNKLLLGEVDVVIEFVPVGQYLSIQAGIEAKTKLASQIEPKKVYFGFTPKKERSKELARLFDEGVREMRKSGELQTLMQKYGLAELKR